MRQLSGQDATFLYLDKPGAHLQLTGLYVYEQPAALRDRLSYGDICRLIGDALSGVDLLRSRLVRPPLDIDFPYWAEDTDFRIERHLHRYPGPVPKSRRDLFEVVSAIEAEPLDLAHSPWEMHVIERLGRIPGLPANGFAIVMKYHHAAIDGASGAALVDRLHGVRPVPGTGGLSVEPGRVPGRLEIAARAVMNNGGNAFALGRALTGSVPAICRSLWRSATFQRQAQAGVPDTRFNGPISAQRVMDGISVSVDRLRAVRQAAPGATVNDVLLTICGGALRRWLRRRDELPETPLVAMVPVNAREGGQAEVSGNQLSALFVPIGTHIEDPVERLKAVRDATSRAKSGEDGFPPEQASAISRHIPALPLAGAARLVTGLGLGHRGLRLCNCTITNVPPNRPGLRLGPARLAYIAGSGPIIDGMGLLISIFSLDGQANLTFTSCPRMLRRPEVLARDAGRELARLERSLRLGA
jgi:WS/DGAT/MGAT family acyltransferase